MWDCATKDRYSSEIVPVWLLVKSKGFLLNYLKYVVFDVSHRLIPSFTRKKPSERFELSTPGLQDQCSNPWATKATTTLSRKAKYTHRGSQVKNVNTEHSIEFGWLSLFNECLRLKSENQQSICAVTRIRTWVIAATTQCTNHYTITACQYIKVCFR